MNDFAGTWASAAEARAALGTACSGVSYTFNRTSDTTADVTYSGTCAGITVTGTGKGALNGSTLTWDASGTATKMALTCPFNFSNGTAAKQADGILVSYDGSVCGVSVRGSQLVHRR
jgi:hypothetical protein